MNIGVLGGTFDPIHKGHLMLAEEAEARFNLREVIFVPAGLPWLNKGPVTAAEHRVEMVRLAIEDKPHFKLSAIEIERAGPSYTVDTIAQMRAELDTGDELFFILGCGSLNELPQWKEPSRLIEMCYLVAAPRPGYLPPNLKALEALMPGISQRVMLLDKPRVDISASAIRDRVAKGLSVYHLVPEAVNKYIKQNKLYLT